MSWPQELAREYRVADAHWMSGLDIPTDWSRSRVKYLVETMRAGDAILSDHIDPAGEYPVYGANGVRGFTTEATHSGTHVLIGRQGALCGNVHLVRGDFWASEHAIVATPASDVDDRWLAALLHVMNLGQYSTNAAQPGIGVSQIAPLHVYVPPIDEQRAIAEYLDREKSQIDALVAKQEELIGLLRERRRTAIQLAFAGIERTRASLRRFANLVSGSGFPIDLQGNADLELPFFKVGNLKSADRDGVLTFPEHTIDRSTAKLIRATVIPKGSLIFAKIGAALLLGRVAALPHDGCIDNNMSALVFDESIDLNYARYLIATFDFRKFVLPGPVPSLDMDGLRDYQVPVLPLDQQWAIAAYLDEQTSRIDTLIAKAEEHIALAKERRSALITAAVTGQIDVRTAAQKAS